MAASGTSAQWARFLLSQLTHESASYETEEAACAAAKLASELAGVGTGYGITGEAGAYTLVKATATATADGGLSISFD